MFNKIKKTYFMFKMRKFMKPIIVWFYLFHKGDEKKICASLERGEMPPERQFKEDMENVNLKEYFTVFDKGFEKFCIKNKINENCLVIKKCSNKNI